MASTLRGRVTWFNSAKGFGEILATTGELFFFTYNELQIKGKFKTIERNKNVEFFPSERKVFGNQTATSIRVIRISTSRSAEKQTDITL